MWYATNGRKGLVSSILIVVVVMLGRLSIAQTPREITPADCATVHYLEDDGRHDPIQFSPKGSMVAYLVRSPNLATNSNDMELYVRMVDASPNDLAVLPLLQAKRLSQFVWLADGTEIVALAETEGTAGHMALVDINILTRHATVLFQTAQDIVEFSIDRLGTSVVFATEDAEEKSHDALNLSGGTRGIRIPFQRFPETGGLPSRQLYLIRRDSENGWLAPHPIVIRSPYTGKRIIHFPHLPANINNLSLSPGGTDLLVSYYDSPPMAWRESPYEKWLRSIGFDWSEVTVLVNLTTDEVTVPVTSPYLESVPVWNTRGDAFAVVGMPPATDYHAIQASADVPTDGRTKRLLWVTLRPNAVQQVMMHSEQESMQPLELLRVGSDDSVLVRTGSFSVYRYVTDGERWHVNAKMKLPSSSFARYGRLASNGELVVGENESIVVAPELSLYERKSDSVRHLAQLNPQFDSRALASERHIEWTTSTGYKIEGILLIPPGHKEGQRDPLVIGTKPYYGEFLCDSGPTHYPSFAPQSLATVGISYLVRSFPDDFQYHDDDPSHYPKGYPGGVAEAALEMDIWNSAVSALDRDGIVDKGRVGIIGYSRSGWYTEFILSHSAFHYRAATVTDNVQYSLGEYWLRTPSLVIDSWDKMYGGPPYGKSLAAWMDYSISFNLDKIHTPILMEEMGYGNTYENDGMLPSSLAEKFEVFIGLNRLKRPVELYYYPTERHQMDHPKAREASLERNLDWYRFWLQGYERPNPEDPDQYRRWKELKRLQDAYDNVGGPQNINGSLK